MAGKPHDKDPEAGAERQCAISTHINRDFPARRGSQRKVYKCLISLSAVDLLRTLDHPSNVPLSIAAINAT
jgi:hypothetical protein